MKQYTRQDVLDRLHGKLASGHIIVASGAGTGISAKFEEAGGSDLLLVFNSGRYRMHGLGSLSGLLAYGDANAIALEMGERQILPIVKEVPVICSVNGTDPTRLMRPFLRRVMDAGFSGVNNFPTVGLIDGRFRMELERTNMGFGKEVDMIRQAHELGFFTCVYVFNPDESRAMAEAGADAIIAHMGLTVGGSIGLERQDAMQLEDAPAAVQAIGEAAWKVKPDAILLCHGGPIATPEDAAYVLARSDAVGFVGASSMERLPVETAIAETMRQFKAVPIRKQ